MALWSTLYVHSDHPEELERLLRDGIADHQVLKLDAKPGHFVVHGPRAQSELNVLAGSAGIKIYTRETDYIDLEDDL